MIIDLIKQIFQPAPEYTLQALAAGTHALPVKQQKKQQKAKVPDPVDSYVIDKTTLTFGFNTATAGLQANKKGTPSLTEEDQEMLLQRNLWGGPEVQIKCAKCKEHWYYGKTKSESAVLLNASPSWTEKRYCVFNAALEIQEK